MISYTLKINIRYKYCNQPMIMIILISSEGTNFYSSHPRNKEIALVESINDTTYWCEFKFAIFLYHLRIRDGVVSYAILCFKA